MRRLTLPFLMLALGSGACGGDSSADLDGGIRVDAFVPSEDSGALPDAQVDAGSDAGAPPSPLTEAVESAQASLVVVDDAFAAVPIEVSSVGPEFLETDLTRVRLDAVVGEKGLISVVGEKGIGTLSLPVEAAPIMVILRNLGAAIESITRVEMGWLDASDAAIMTLRDALTALRLDLTTLRAELLVRFRDVVTDTAGLGRTDAGYEDFRAFHITPDGLTTQMLVEAEPSNAAAVLRVDCGTALLDLAIAAHDDESGEELLTVAANGGLMNHTIPVRAGEPTLLRVHVTPNVPVGSWQPCTLTIVGHRHWRGDPVTIDGTTLSAQASRWNSAITSLDSEIGLARSAGTFEDEAVADVVQRFAAEASIETAFWRRGDATIEADEQELALASLPVIADMFLDLLATPQLSSTTWEHVRGQLATMQSANDTAIATLAR